MFWSVSVGESAEKAESTVKLELFSKVSFRVGISKINEQKCFKKTNRVVALPTDGGVLISTKFIYEGEVNTAEKNFKGVIKRYNLRNDIVSKVRLIMSSRCLSSDIKGLRYFNDLGAKKKSNSLQMLDFQVFVSF
ncbi:hypothetical protein JCM13991_19430 [Thermodesulfovibrio hydrogeniphilus]